MIESEGINPGPKSYTDCENHLRRLHGLYGMLDLKDLSSNRNRRRGCSCDGGVAQKSTSGHNHRLPFTLFSVRSIDKAYWIRCQLRHLNQLVIKSPWFLNNLQVDRYCPWSSKISDLQMPPTAILMRTSEKQRKKLMPAAWEFIKDFNFSLFTSRCREVLLDARLVFKDTRYELELKFHFCLTPFLRAGKKWVTGVC
ncbi:unnamed protein product [Allacma fusca]|uniref:Uncharacterized protein n=1 Tax=Allacma fusca TaxID=39272 RepID=A0A8J2NXK3_9HEXA|nr:unnamed protein product [Allacma fusca]